MSSGPTSGEEPSAIKAVEATVFEHPFLAGLKPEQLRVLADNALRMQYEPGVFIFRQDDPANRFYLIEHGQVSLESRRQDEPPVCIQTIGPGDVLGWSWLFPPYYWNFDARAVERTTAIFFYGTRLREQCEQDKALGFELLKRMTAMAIQRLQATRRQILALRK